MLLTAAGDQGDKNTKSGRGTHTVSYRDDASADMGAAKRRRLDGTFETGHVPMPVPVTGPETDVEICYICKGGDDDAPLYVCDGLHISDGDAEDTRCTVNVHAACTTDNMTVMCWHCPECATKTRRVRDACQGSHGLHKRFMKEVEGRRDKKLTWVTGQMEQPDYGQYRACRAFYDQVFKFEATLPRA